MMEGGEHVGDADVSNVDLTLSLRFSKMEAASVAPKRNGPSDICKASSASVSFAAMALETGIKNRTAADLKMAKEILLRPVILLGYVRNEKDSDISGLTEPQELDIGHCFEITDGAVNGRRCTHRK